jgi:hypothetical protein
VRYTRQIGEYFSLELQSSAGGVWWILSVIVADEYEAEGTNLTESGAIADAKREAIKLLRTEADRLEQEN